MQFYDVHEQTKYRITVSKPESVDQLSDLFMTEDELSELIGKNFWFHGNGQRTYLLNGVITTELLKWADKLDASGKKTLLIEDEELVDVLKDRNCYVSDFIDDAYGRHGERICYARRYKRVKKRATKGDVRDFWSRIIPHAFRYKFDCYPSHIPTYDRHIVHFKAWKKILGWKVCRKFMDSDNWKFYRQIWDNPEEFI